MKKLLFLAFLPLLLAGCSKDEPTTDPRDQYEGNYRYTMIGSLSMNYGGAILYTVPMNENGNATITKSGESKLETHVFIILLAFFVIVYLFARKKIFNQ
jgi:hypothetical protein